MDQREAPGSLVPGIAWRSMEVELGTDEAHRRALGGEAAHFSNVFQAYKCSNVESSRSVERM